MVMREERRKTRQIMRMRFGPTDDGLDRGKIKLLF